MKFAYVVAALALAFVAMSTAAPAPEAEPQRFGNGLGTLLALKTGVVLGAALSSKGVFNGGFLGGRRFRGGGRFGGRGRRRNGFNNRRGESRSCSISACYSRCVLLPGGFFF